MAFPRRAATCRAPRFGAGAADGAPAAATGCVSRCEGQRRWGGIRLGSNGGHRVGLEWPQPLPQRVWGVTMLFLGLGNENQVLVSQVMLGAQAAALVPGDVAGGAGCSGRWFCSPRRCSIGVWLELCLPFLPGPAR